MQTSTHIDRRVLDKTQRAELAHFNGGYDVVAGEGRIWLETYDAAFVSAYMHNSMNGFDVSGSDRRTP